MVGHFLTLSCTFQKKATKIFGTNPANTIWKIRGVSPQGIRTFWCGFQLLFTGDVLLQTACSMEMPDGWVLFVITGLMGAIVCAVAGIYFYLYRTQMKPHQEDMRKQSRPLKPG